MTSLRLRIAGMVGAGMLALGATNAAAELLPLPDGMGGVSDIGAIQCSVYSNMIRIGPLGSRLSLLTWAAGYYAATSGKTLHALATAPGQPGGPWDFDRLTTHLVDYCAANPQAVTADAVRDLAANLGVAR
ncbi:MAG: hypothetical protein FJ197_00630 [Gammaproteobacteria bacterium]|nr:hypothetical protein [Gammaproteobacteria bacterium]